MNDIREIIRAYDRAIEAGKKSALATVVHLNGSSYRRPGARMLVTDHGELTGAISGGCLEGDALRKAMFALSQQQSKLVTYDTNDEDDATIGFQLGCEGVIEVLFEPLDPNDKNNPIQLFRKATALRQKSVLVTLFSGEEKKNPHPGTSLLLEENGDISGSIPNPELYNAVMEDVLHAMEQQVSSFRKYTCNATSVTGFIELLQPPISLVVVGAGNDAIPVTQIAAALGWDVKVIDGRSTHAKRGRFVSSCQVLVSKPEKVLEQISIDPNTVFVVMTHNYNYDLAMLRILLRHRITYIGMLGPKKRLNRILDELRNEGIDLNETKLDTIYGPAGLEIGAETAEEIALSIIAEIKAVLARMTGGSLRQKKEEIHSRTTTIIEEKTLH